MANTERIIHNQHAFSWWEVTLNLLATMSVFISMAIITPTLDVIIRQRFVEMESAVKQFTLFHSLPQLLLVGILAGFFSDKVGRRYVFIIPCLLITGLITLLIPQINDFQLLLGIRLVDGATGIVALGLLLAKLLDLCSLHPERRSLLMALYGSCIPASYLIGNVLTLVLAPYGERLIFAVAGTSVVVVGLGLTVCLRSSEHIIATHASPLHFFRSFKRAPRLWDALLFGFADKLVIASVVILTGRALAELYNREGSQAAGFVLALNFTGFILFSRVATWAIARTSAITTMFISSCLHGIVLLALPYTDYVGYCVLMTIGGVLTPFQFIACLTILGQRSSSSEYGTNSQLFNFFGSLGMIIGFPLFASLANQDTTLKLPYLASGVIQLVVVWIGLIILGWQRYFGVSHPKEPIRSTAVEISDKLMVEAE
ncbi:MAG: MFS transporter [Sumerlaeia bacterium]